MGMVWTVYGAIQTGVTYGIETDEVKIHMETFTKKDGKERVWKEDKNVLPGDCLSRIPRIYNDGTDCYIRVSLETESEKGTSHTLSWENLKGISNQWKQIGDYYYYQKMVPSGEYVEFFHEIQIPDQWEQEMEEKENWNIQLKADAIQAENVRPDFSSQDPWHTEKEHIKIQKVSHGNIWKNRSLEKEEEESAVVLEINQDLEGFSVQDKEFFKKLYSFVPGTTRTGRVELGNHTGCNRSISFFTKAEGEEELLKKMELVIRITEKDCIRILYQGALLTEKREFLIQIPDHEVNTLEFQIRLPRDTDNRYGRKKGKVTFFFDTDVPQKELDTAVQTGDDTSFQPLWSFCVSGVVAFCTVLKRKECRKKKKEDD